MASEFDQNAKLASQIESWRSRLLDIGNRNPLINTSFNPSRGVLEFANPEPEVVWRKLITAGEAGSKALRFPWKRDLVPSPDREVESNGDIGQLSLDLEAAPDVANEKETKDWNPPISECLASSRLRSDDLLTTIGDRALDRRIRTLDGYADLSISEQGIHCLFLAFGFIKWFESADSSKEIRSPLILVPATFTRETSDSPWELQEAEDDVVDNLCLRQRFKQDFGLELPPLPELEQLEEDGARLAYLAEVREAISKILRWEVEDRCCLGRFAFPKIAMWQDLGDHVESIASSTICQSIGGQSVDDPQVAFGDPTSVPDARQLDDHVGPGEIKAILDCDSSQLEAIVAAKKGISFVLDGPPGTGKSQTIANIIADALSVGKRVLFVSEKVAALEVVKRRLDDCGLGDFCLECHSSKANRKTVLEELKWCLEIPVETYPDPTPKLNDLRKQRKALNDYVRILHQPQQPIGLSMYELHGNIARLTRKGMLGRSRIEFSEPELVARSTLDSWIQLLRFAPQHQNVLASFASHPWRGCRLTNQTLALKSDIRSNFALLSDKAAQLAQDLSPLEEASLIPEGTNPVNLKSLLGSLELNLTIPDIPAGWFASPREIARALLDRHNAHLQSVQLRQSLSEYVNDVSTLFSDTIVPLSDLRSCAWLERLTSPLPNSYKDCRDVLTSHAQLLRDFEGSLSTFENALEQLVAEIKLPIKADLPIGSVWKLLSAARLVATDAPFRAAWFEPERATEIVANAKDVIAKLESINALEQSVKERINPEELLKLASEVEDIDVLKRSWDFVKTNVAASKIESLDELAQRLTQEQERLGRIDADLNSVASALQWNGSFAPTFDEARTIIEALPKLFVSRSYNGNWADATTRGRVKQQIEAVLLDLSEAQDLRKDLESKFSHRAFLPTARAIVNKGNRFASWWTRLIGGYSKYRMEVADLYKSAVPETKPLLSDIQQLATFHKRMGEVESAHQKLKELLLPGVVADQIESWQETLTALSSFGAFISAAPQAASVMPTVAVAISMRPDDPLITRLLGMLQPTSGDASSSAKDSMGISNLRINEALQFVTELQLATNRCTAAIQASNTKYQAKPDMQQLLNDIASAKVYANQLESVEAVFVARAPDLPEDAAPFHAAGWLAAIRGVESADKLTKTFSASPVLKEIVCTSGRVDQGALNTLCQSTESAFQQVNKTWSEQIAFINLTNPGQQEIEPRKRIATELKACVGAAASEFETITSRLSKLLAVLKPGHAVPLERLPQDAKAIEELRQAQSTIDRCTSLLSKFNIEHPLELNDGDFQVCDWITRATVDLLGSQLAQAIATSPELRTKVRAAVNSLTERFPQWQESWDFFATCFDVKEDVSTGFVPETIAIKDLPVMLHKLIGEIDLVDEWLSFKRWRTELKRCHLYRCLEELLSNQYSPEEAVDAVCARFYQQLFDHSISNLPYIGDFDGVRHEQIRDKYRALDEWEIKAAAARVREFQLSREDRPRIGWLAPMTSELGILKKETEKKRRHMPLRKLFNAVPGVLQRLKPCIMMSPLSVSTFLHAEALRFDLVIFDEASQVFPWDAIGAIYRGSQLIVAGDDKQLPPTSFFSRADIESEEEEDDIGDFESILSLCKSVNMPNKRLRWHYRSRREPLIAFSNKHFYDGDLVTFPSVRDAASDAVRLIHVPDGLWSDRKNLPEARRVAELVVEHYRGKPDKSLGVIAFNATQQQAIEDAIYELRRSSPVIDVLLKEGTHETLFIKNLENVQGDERDVILLSFGYGKNEAGKFIKNFGPLSKPGGERRLNVAVTRAREAVSLVASVRSSDMDLTGSTSIGAQLLKAYLEYAEHGVDSMSQSIVETQGDCESPFEEEVAAALIRHGLEPVPQVGCGGFRIDLALKHPAHPGLYCLGIECDGATYHSSKTARDRDRIRQSILEGLGWRICRVWSTDWIRNPELQIQRILSVYEQVAVIPPDLAPVPAARPEPEFEDLQPLYVADDTVKTPTYLKIEDVPTQQIIDVSLRIVTRVGTIDWSELVSLTSRELGFARTGRKIRERIELILHDQVCQSILHRTGERISFP
jgi:very-short-patch-repair endonuclease